ncbi:MAG: hypothetical protein K9M99_13430 [Candidatus Cloacimonetes bacterium]|nr:hypothetical protein [Candidatus Cloacimonadota bacterium]
MRFIIMILLLPFIASAVLLEVIQDGSGDYVSINEAMAFSVAGDTILVYPGIYYENIYLFQDISLVSLYDITGDEDYIDSTILDGNSENCVIFTEKYNDEYFEVLIAGFTIQNGFARSFLGGEHPTGAGIYACGINITIDGCIIKDNTAFWGGGVSISIGIMNMANTIITNNTAYQEAGGLYIANSECYFSEESLNSIYLNFGGKINDVIFTSEAGNILDIHLDTFTVSEYESYFVQSFQDPYVEDPQFINLTVDNYLIEPVTADLYVSPEGNNDNSGLSENDPLRTVSYALALYATNSLETHTIHLAEGYYGRSANGECLPWQLKSNLTIEGESEEGTIISTEGKTGHLRGDEFLHNVTVRNMTLQDGNMFASVRIYDLDGLTLDNITVRGVNWVDGIISIGTSNAELKNLNFEDNVVGGIFSLINNSNQYMMIENVNISGVYQYESLIYPCDGSWAIATMSNSPLEYARYDIVNCKFVDVYTENCTYPMIVGHGCSFNLFSDVNMVNCVVSNTRTNNDRDPCIDLMDSRLKIINSIVYDVDNEAVHMNYYDMMLPEVTVDHSLIQDGEDGITGYWGNLNWLEGNLDCDPIFDMNEPNRYSLHEGSPCIDAGTFELPEGIELPEYDLAGNPRISGSMIDMGPYEWQYQDSNEENEITALANEVIVYPNPLIPDKLRYGRAKILWQGEVSEDLSFEIFNIKGQRVRELKSNVGKRETGGGSRIAVWDLCDEAGKTVSSGVYFVRVKAEAEYVAQRKVTVVK